MIALRYYLLKQKQEAHMWKWIEMMTAPCKSKLKESETSGEMGKH